LACSVVGLIGNEHTNWVTANVCFNATARRARQRGRDSFGVTRLRNAGQVSETKYLYGKFEVPMLDKTDRVVILNCRGEPTTEWVKYKSEADVQPLTDRTGTWFVSHNGTIANDRELVEKYRLFPRTKIDTAAFVELLATYPSPRMAVEESIRRVKGSYAFVIGNRNHVDRMWIATNYKPLYRGYNRHGKFWLIATLDDYILPWTYDKTHPDLGGWTVTQVPAYTAWELDATERLITCGRLNVGSQFNELTGRTLVVCSGGLDSSTLVAHLKATGERPGILHFGYGARASNSEWIAVSKVAQRLGVPVHELSATSLFREIGGSPLTGTAPIQKDRGGEAGAEYAHEWVPARNTIFYAAAVAYAESHGYDTVALGLNLEESGAFPDNEIELVRKFNAMMPWVVNEGKYVELTAPFAHLMKHEIVRVGLYAEKTLGVRYLDVTHSCYEGGPVPCNNCGPCYMRRHAFRMNGVIDPLSADASLAHGVTWEGCVPYGALEESWYVAHPIDDFFETATI
jgi:7-cyano-7-deazaguanine synthase